MDLPNAHSLYGNGIVMENYKKKINIACILTLIITLVLDQLTKYLAQIKLSDGAFKIIDGVFSFTYLENRGVGFGFLQNKMYLILAINIIILILVFIYYTKLPKTNRFFFLHVLITLIVSGALGNMIDRIRLGYVIDFFYFELIDFPIFNVADIYVTVSVILLMVLVIFFYSSEELDLIVMSSKKSKVNKDDE